MQVLEDGSGEVVESQAGSPAEDLEAPPFIFDVLGSRGVAALVCVSALEIGEERGLWLGGAGMLGDKVQMEVFSHLDMASLPYAPIDVVYALWKIFRAAPSDGEAPRAQYSRPSLLKEVVCILRESDGELDFNEGCVSPLPPRVVPPSPSSVEVQVVAVDIAQGDGSAKRIIFGKPKKVQG